MREVVVDETMYDMDKNKDGQITLEEYISELKNKQQCIIRYRKCRNIGVQKSWQLSRG